MKQILAQIKPYVRWFILGGVWFFLAKTIKDRFAEIATVRIDTQSWLILATAVIITIVAHIWSGWVWTWIVAMFKQPLGTKEGIRIYLITNIAKYSPGNIWHFYGRIAAIARKGGSKGEATLSVLLEPLLMAAAALCLGLVISSLGGLEADVSFLGKIASLISSKGGEFASIINAQSLLLLLKITSLGSLIAVLVGIHPRILNKVLHRLSSKKNQGEAVTAETVKLTSYPLIPFVGESGFVILRGFGFILTFIALQSVTWSQIPQLMSAFCFAWLLGLIVPGAPGGLGVFEITAYSLLDNSQFPTEIAAVGLYRLISILAEAIAALSSWQGFTTKT
ncbi:MAG: lysylphosphatidylglycerol synthase domain-containing protein [Waterburya sp.]